MTPKIGRSRLPRFSFLTGDMNWLRYGGSWVSRKQNNSDFDYWLVIRFLNTVEETGELWDGCKYHVELIAVSPSEAGPENLDRAFSCVGLDGEEESRRKELEFNPLVQVEALMTYGIYSPLWQSQGNNAYSLLKAAREQAMCAMGLFGFYMDGPKNRAGATGWDSIKGNLVPAS